MERVAVGSKKWEIQGRTTQDAAKGIDVKSEYTKVLRKVLDVVGELTPAQLSGIGSRASIPTGRIFLNVEIHPITSLIHKIELNAAMLPIVSTSGTAIASAAIADEFLKFPSSVFAQSTTLARLDVGLAAILIGGVTFLTTRAMQKTINLAKEELDEKRRYVKAWLEGKADNHELGTPWLSSLEGPRWLLYMRKHKEYDDEPGPPWRSSSKGREWLLYMRTHNLHMPEYDKEPGPPWRSSSKGQQWLLYMRTHNLHVPECT